MAGETVCEHVSLSCFAKYEISGEDSEVFLKRICTNRLPKPEADSSGGGGVSLVHMLTELGGIECEATITRLEQNLF